MSDNPPTSADAAPALTEARYSLQALLREVEYERQHSILNMELVDQAEIGMIFKSRRRKPAKNKKT